MWTDVEQCKEYKWTATGLQKADADGEMHYNDVVMGAIASQITSLTIVYSVFRRRSKKTSKLRVTGLCAGNSPGTGEFPAQMASNTENVSIWWRHHGAWVSARVPLGISISHRLKLRTDFIKVEKYDLVGSDPVFYQGLNFSVLM